MHTHNENIERIYGTIVLPILICIQTSISKKVHQPIQSILVITLANYAHFTCQGHQQDRRLKPTLEPPLNGQASVDAPENEVKAGDQRVLDLLP